MKYLKKEPSIDIDFLNHWDPYQRSRRRIPSLKARYLDMKKVWLNGMDARQSFGHATVSVRHSIFRDPVQGNRILSSHKKGYSSAELHGP